MSTSRRYGVSPQGRIVEAVQWGLVEQRGDMNERLKTGFQRVLLGGALLWLLTLVAVEPVSVATTVSASQIAAGFDGQALWEWPTGSPTQVARAFDRPPNPWNAGHRGVDLAAEAGTPVLSSAPGTVVHAGTVAGRPTVSVMHSGGLRTTYEPVDPSVAVGQMVAAGDQVGVLIDVADSSHTGLHWGARFEKNNYIDPLRLLLGPSVLKPW